MSETPVQQRKKVDISERVWKFFTSLRLVIFLLLILSVLSIAGTVIEQNKPLSEYYRVFRPDTVAFFNKIGLFDMYHSWWFVAILALLAMNLIACTMDRYGPILAGFKRRNPVLDDRVAKTLNPLEKIKLPFPMDASAQKVLEAAGKTFSGKPVITEGQDGSRHFFFEKGRYGRLAFFFTHLSVLLLFIGALIGSFFGYKGYVNIFEGESATRLQTRAGATEYLDFQVRCNSFAVDFYPNGAPKDYRSDLSVIKEGREILRKVIRVNDPLTVSGISFYQSSYGYVPEMARIEVLNQDGTTRGTVDALYGQRVDVPGTADKIEVADFQERFRMPGGAIAGKALGVNIFPEKSAPMGIWLLGSFPDYDKMRQGEYFLRIGDLKLKSYTGLQVNKDPGEWVVWISCILLTLGIMASFFVSHRKVWIALKKDKKGRTDVTIGGTANKNRDPFSREVGEMIQRMKEIGQ